MMTDNLPTSPGYYWAKLKTPSGGTIYGTSAGTVQITDDDLAECVSLDWEIVEVHDNNGTGDEKFSVSVFGIPVTQWPLDFFWGPKIEIKAPGHD